MISDEEYEAELQARTPEQWAELRDKALADGYDIVALSHLMWRRDIKDWEHITKLLSKPDMSLSRQSRSESSDNQGKKSVWGGTEGSFQE